MINYQTGKNIEKFVHAQCPKVFFLEEPYKNLSCAAKLLYTSLLDYSNYSRKNGIFDEGRAYVVKSQEMMADELNCGVKKVRRVLTELEISKLIEIKRMGLNRANRIFVSDMSKDLRDHNLYDFLVEGENMNGDFQQMGQSEHHYRVKKEIPIGQNKLFSMSKPPSIKTISKTIDKQEYISSYLSIKNNGDYQFDEEFIEGYKVQIDLESLRDKYKDGNIDNIFEIIKTVLLGNREFYRIKGSSWSRKQVIDEFLLLREAHLDFVRYKLNNLEGHIKNPDMYIIAMLFNARKTMDICYSNDHKL